MQFETGRYFLPQLKQSLLLTNPDGSSALPALIRVCSLPVDVFQRHLDLPHALNILVLEANCIDTDNYRSFLLLMLCVDESTSSEEQELRALYVYLGSVLSH